MHGHEGRATRGRAEQRAGPPQIICCFFFLFLFFCFLQILFLYRNIWFGVFLCYTMALKRKSTSDFGQKDKVNACKGYWFWCVCVCRPDTRLYYAYIFDWINCLWNTIYFIWALDRIVLDVYDGRPPQIARLTELCQTVGYPSPCGPLSTAVGPTLFVGRVLSYPNNKTQPTIHTFSLTKPFLSLGLFLPFFLFFFFLFGLFSFIVC